MYPLPPAVANKDQRKFKQGFGVQDPTQPTTDLERQSHIADSVGKGEKLGKVTTVFCGVLACPPHIRSTLPSSPDTELWEDFCAQIWALLPHVRPYAPLRCYESGLLLQCLPHY